MYKVLSMLPSTESHTVDEALLLPHNSHTTQSVGKAVTNQILIPYSLGRERTEVDQETHPCLLFYVLPS